MTALLGPTEARQLVALELGESNVARHSAFVGDLLAILAQRLHEPVALWQTVGYCHDLDYFAVEGDWSRHGLITADKLAGRLPAVALEAIAAHDHRTGRKLESRLAHLLRYADAVAVLDENIGRARLVEAIVLGRSLMPQKPYLEVMVREIGGREGLELSIVPALLAELPEQQSPST